MWLVVCVPLTWIITHDIRIVSVTPVTKGKSGDTSTFNDPYDTSVPCFDQVEMLTPTPTPTDENDNPTSMRVCILTSWPRIVFDPLTANVAHMVESASSPLGK